MKAKRLRTFLTMATLLAGGMLFAGGCHQEQFRDSGASHDRPGPLVPGDVDHSRGYGEHGYSRDRDLDGNLDHSDRGPNGGIRNDRYGSNERYRGSTTSDEKNPSPSGQGPRKLWGDDTGGSAPASEGR